MIRPQLDAPQETIAEDQAEYFPLTGAFVTHPDFGHAKGATYNTVVVAFRPSDEERRRLAAGEDLYIGLLTFGAPMQPIQLMIGREEAAACYRVGLSL